MVLLWFRNMARGEDLDGIVASEFICVVHHRAYVQKR